MCVPAYSLFFCIEFREKRADIGIGYETAPFFIGNNHSTSDFLYCRIWTFKQPVYEEFVEGAKDGFWTVIKIMPTLIGLMVAVGVLRASGLLDCIAQGLGQITAEIGFPAELFPVTIVKMFSSSAATGLLLDIYKEYGADSTLGKMASVMMSSTETIFYTMSVYFMSVKVKKTRYTLAGALLATVAGTIASVVIVSYM